MDEGTFVTSVTPGLSKDHSGSNDLVELLPKDSWLRRWFACWETTEFPASYILFSGLSSLGAVLGRKVWFDEDFRKLWPMVNLLLIGPSGIGKSSTIHLARKYLLSSLPFDERPQFIIGGATPEKLHEDLVANPKAILFASELANFFNRQKYMEGMIPYVTELLDYEPVEKRTKSYQILRVEEPEVTVQGGSTVPWLQEALPDSAVAGGFLPRFLILQEAFRRQRVPIPSMAISATKRKQIEELRPQVSEEFGKMARKAKGQIGFKDFDAADQYIRWYNKHQAPSGHLEPFAARAHEHIKRLGMLVAITCGRDSISAADVRTAVGLYSYTEKKLQQVVVPFSPIGKMIGKLMEVIPRSGANYQEICHYMKNFITSQETTKLLESLMASGDVTLDNEGKYHRQENFVVKRS